MVKVYENNPYEYGDYDQKIIARVKYNSALDNWNGSNWQNGGVGMHKGITKLKDGRFVIIIGSQWQGSTDYGYVVTHKEALQEILESGRDELLEEKKFAPLKELMEKELIQEEE